MPRRLPSILLTLFSVAAGGGCDRPSRPPEFRVADTFLEEMKSGYMGTASLYTLPIVSETAGRARQRNPAWWGTWTPGESRKAEVAGSLEATEVSGELAGTDGVRRPCLVTVVKTDTWRVARVFVAGVQALPAPLDPADTKKPAILLCEIQHQYVHEKGFDGWAAHINVVFAGRFQGEASPTAFRLTALALASDGAQYGEAFDVVLKASEVRDLTQIELKPTWKLTDVSAKAQATYRLHLTVRNETTGESSSIDRDLR